MFTGIIMSDNGTIKSDITYATVKEYNSFLDSHPQITFKSGDLKNFQRPWVVDSIFKRAPIGSRLLEIGADKCELADYLQKQGYEVWVIDKFESFGGGVAKIDEVQNRFPNINFIKGFMHEDKSLPGDYFDAIYSCSVIEHTPLPVIPMTFSHIFNCLRPSGWSIHAIDFTIDGPILKNHGLIDGVLMWHNASHNAIEIGACASNDIETFYLSPSGHHNWRMFLGKTYEEYPYRKVTSLNLLSQKVL